MSSNCQTNTHHHYEPHRFHDEVTTKMASSKRITKVSKGYCKRHDLITATLTSHTPLVRPLTPSTSPQELADLSKEPLSGITISASEANVYHWQATIAGPTDSPYAKGSFQLSLEFPPEYPFKGPKVRFATKIYHPNVDEEGNLCLGILKSEAWKPSTKAATGE